MLWGLGLSSKGQLWLPILLLTTTALQEIALLLTSQNDIVAYRQRWEMHLFKRGLSAIEFKKYIYIFFLLPPRTQQLKINYIIVKSTLNLDVFLLLYQLSTNAIFFSSPMLAKIRLSNTLNLDVFLSYRLGVIYFSFPKNVSSGCHFFTLPAQSFGTKNCFRHQIVQTSPGWMPAWASSIK